MKLWPHRRMKKHEDQRPDIDRAHRELARIKAQRPAVDELVAALIVERHLNNFSANLTATFRGGRQ